MASLKKSILLLLLGIGLSFGADRISVIQYPLTARPALVESGGTFTIMCKASSSVSSWGARLSTPFNTVNLSVSGNYNSAEGMWYLTATVPTSTPFELYDLTVTASGLEDQSVHAVKVLSEFRDSYYFIHVPDMHLPSVYWIGYYDDDNTVPEVLKIFEQISIINPEFVLQTGDFVDNGQIESQYQNAQQILYASQVPMFLTGGNHDLWYEGHTNWKRYFSPVMDYSFNYGDHHYSGMEMYDTPTVTFTADQMSWLQSDLQQSIDRQDPMRTLFYHYDESRQIDDDFVDDFEIDLMLYGHTHLDHVDTKGSRRAVNINTSYTMDDKGIYRLVKVTGDQVESWPLLTMNKFDVNYSPANDGSNWKVTATITNENNVRFENGLIKFYVAHNSAGYSVTGGQIEQSISTNDTDVYYVSVDIAANSVQQVDIVSNAPPANQPPQISSFSPDKDVSVMAGSQVPFSITASDPDNSTLSYNWYLNGQIVTGTQPTYNYNIQKQFTGMVELTARVSDGTFYDEQTWNIEVREYSSKPVIRFASMDFYLHNEETELTWDEPPGIPMDIKLEYGLEPGVYTASISENGNNSLFFTPELEGMGLGVHYCRLTDGDVSSDPFTMVIESPVAPLMQYPIGDVPDLSPVFSWDPVTGVPYYVVICSDEEIIIEEDELTQEFTVEGANPIWSVLTSETSVAYGQPDPSGTYTSAPAPLIPGESYWWVVLNCYGNVPELTSSVQSGISKFTIDLDPPDLDAPVLIYPPDNAELDADVIPFSWEPVEGASAYHLYPFKLESEFGIETARAVWQSTITTTETQYDYPAGQQLMKGDYRWKVAAVSENGLEVLSDGRDFVYDAPSAELSIYTYHRYSSGSDQGEPLPRVTIKYEPIDGIHNDMPLSTDLHGQRLNYAIAPGTYKFTVTKDGFDSIVDTLVFQADQHYNKSFWLVPSSSAISGKIVDGTGTGVSDASITARHSLHEEIIKTGVSDAQGNFRMTLTPGPYLIWAKKTGYQESDTTNISVTTGEEATLAENIVIIKNNNRVTGKVVNTQQQPVYGATVILKNGEILNNVTDANGQFQFSAPDGSWELFVRKQGFISPGPRQVSTSGGQIITISPALVLTSNAGILQGRVSDGSRQLDGVQVKAYPVSGDAFETSTDNYGQFTLNVSGGTYTLTVEKEGYIPQGDVQITVEDGATQSGIEIEMLPAQCTIRGKVTIDGYTPLQGVLVSNSGKSALTSEGGFFELGVEAGTHIISAHKEGYISSQPISVSVTNGQVLEQVNFVLSPNASVIKGKILSDGSPVYNASVKAEGLQTIEIKSDQEGQYVLNLESGSWDLSVTKNGFSGVTENDLVIGVGQTLANKNFELTPSTSDIKGKVVSRLNGALISNATVSILSLEASTRTATDGTFTFAVNPGNYELSVEKAGYKKVNTNTGDIASNSSIDLLIEMEPVESSFKGKITDADGNPLSQVTITAVSSLESFDALSKSDGSFRIDVKAGSYSVTAQKTGFKTVSWGDKVIIEAFESKTLAQQSMDWDRGTLTGTVHRVANDDPVASAKITAVGQSGFSLQIQSNNNGEFLFVDDNNNPVLVPDVYTVIASKSGFTPDTLTNIQVQTDQTTQIDAYILKNDGIITGNVTVGGVALAEVTVTARRTATGETFTALSKEDGAFAIKSIPVGDYSLTAAKVGYSSPGAMSVSTGNDYPLQLVKNNGRIAGNVADKTTSAGVVGVQVSASDNLGNFASAETDAYGNFDLQDLPQVQNYTLEFSRSGYHSFSYGPVSANATTGLKLNMEKIIGQISGNVVDESNNPVAGVLVNTRKGETVISTTTDATGNYAFPNLEAEQYNVSVFKVGYAGDPVQQIVALWQGGTITVNFVMKDAKAAQLKILGPDILSNQSQETFSFSAQTSDQREASIEPVWSVDLASALENFDQNGMLDPANDYMGTLNLTLTDTYSGLSTTKSLGIIQALVPQNTELQVSNKQGVEIFVEDSCVTQNAVLQLRRPELASSMRKDKKFEIVGDVFDLSPANFRFTKPAELRLPVPDDMDAESLLAGKWNMDKLEWEILKDFSAGIGQVTIPLTTLGRYTIMEQAKPLGIHNIRFSPNPFSPNVAPLDILFELTSDLTVSPIVTVKIYNMVGDLVKTLANGELLETGDQVLQWDGMTDYGKMALNGRYLIHFRIKDSSGEKEELKTFVLIK